MAYTPTVWKNGEFPPIDAEHLNKIEQGIANSAPGGFGLGSNIVYAPSNSDGQADANLIDATGFYLARANVGYGGWSYILHMQYPSGAGDALQFSSPVNETLYGVRKKIDGVWQPFEWVNPPMLNDVDYATIERYKGNPVHKGLLGDFEVWGCTAFPGWVSAGKPILYAIGAGETKNISLSETKTYIFSASDNARYGVAIVQCKNQAVGSVTPLVSLGNWKIEAGDGLSVNVTEQTGTYSLTVSAMML